MSKTPNEEITDILVDNPALTLIQNGEKVKCTLSGHEMPAKKDALQSYISGKKYQRLHKMKECDLEKYKRHLVPSSKKWRKNQLFCLLTLRHLNNSPVHIQRHTDGKRFQKALHRCRFDIGELCQETGMEFKARQGRKRPQVDSDPSDEEDEGREEDNLDDLYPPADFLSSDQHARDVSGSEGELDENMEPERCSPAKKTPGSGPKNKVPGGSSKATKRKKSDGGKVKQPSGKRAK